MFPILVGLQERGLNGGNGVLSVDIRFMNVCTLMTQHLQTDLYEMTLEY